MADGVNKEVFDLMARSQAENSPRPATVIKSAPDPAPTEAATSSEERMADMVFMAQKGYTERLVAHTTRPLVDGMAAMRAEFDQLRSENVALRRTIGQLQTKLTVLQAKARPRG